MKKLMSLVLSLILLISSIPVIYASASEAEIPEGFTGVYNIEDLYAIRYALDGNYILMADIDMTEDTAPGGDWDNGYGWAPIGENADIPFTGIFDGNGHTIKGMQITGIRTDYAGLFGYIKDGKLINLNMLNIAITENNTAQYVGGVAGFATNMIINNIKVSGTIDYTTNKSDSFVGGVIGWLDGNSKLEKCSNLSTINGCTNYHYSWGNNRYYGYAFAGGIAGTLNGNSSIVLSYNMGSVSSKASYGTYVYSGSESYAGGITGDIRSGTVENCYNTGTISVNGKDVYVGGISSRGNVNCCINLGSITLFAGNGLRNYKSSISSGSLTYCYYLKGTADNGCYQTADSINTAVAITDKQMTIKSVFGYLDFENIWFLDTSKGINHPQLIANPEKTHTHTYESIVTDPTCTEKGYTNHTCSECNDSYVDTYVDALGHNFGDWKVTKPAACTEKGEETRYCSRCDAFETREVKANGHSYKNVVTAPTCTEKGYTTHTCSACQDSYVDTYVNALGHDYKAVVIKPTCTEQGYTTYTCSRCNDSYKADYVPANGHTDGEWKVTKQPTLTSEGTKTLYCSVCGKVIRTESIPKLTQGRVYRVKVDDVSLNYKKSTTLKPGIEADNGVKYTVKYESSNPKVATVDQNGNVTATKRGSGSATITCTVTDQYGNVVKDTCKVNVSLTFGQKIIVYVLFGWIWY